MIPGCWLSVSIYHGHTAQRPPVIKKAFRKVTFSTTSWEHTTEEKRPVLWHHARHWLCYNETQQCAGCVCVCEWDSVWTEHVPWSMALCEPSVSQTYPCLHIRTSSRGYQKPYRGQVLRCYTSCVFVLWPALSCSAWFLGGPVSSSHTVTNPAAEIRQPTLNTSSLSVIPFPSQTLHWKPSPSFSTSFFRCETPHRAGLRQTHGFVFKKLSTK